MSRPDSTRPRCVDSSKRSRRSGLNLPGRVFLCTLPTDMRKSFDRLVAQHLGADPLQGGSRRGGKNSGVGLSPGA